MMRRELGPVWVGVEVCPKAEDAEEQDNRDTVSECVEGGTCVCAYEIGSLGDTLVAVSM